MSRLITTSLLDSIDWCRKAPDSLNPAGISWKQDAYEQLKRTVGRAPWVPNASLERGTTFENQIYGILKAGTEDTVQCTPKFREILYACKGGQFQRKTKSFLTIDGQEKVKLRAEDEVRVRTAKQTVRLVTLKGHSFFEVLRQKMQWRGAHV